MIAGGAESRALRRFTIRKLVLLVLVAAVAALIVDFETAPRTTDLFLEAPGAPGHEASRRAVCAVLDRPKAWIAVPRGGSLYSEIRASKQLLFETDPGSGLATVCVTQEQDYKSRPEIVAAVLAACRPRYSIGRFRAAPEDQVALLLENEFDDTKCERRVDLSADGQSPSPGHAR
jgi:hypothetical protein